MKAGAACVLAVLLASSLAAFATTAALDEGAEGLQTISPRSEPKLLVSMGLSGVQTGGSGLQRRGRSLSEPQFVMPSASDPVVSDATQLISLVNSPTESHKSIRIAGMVPLGGTILTIQAGQVVTLWGESGDALDGEGLARVITVDDGGALYISGVDVLRGRRNDIGACVRNGGWFRMHGGRIAGCLLSDVSDTIAENNEAVGAGLLNFEGTSEVVGTRFENNMVETNSRRATGGGFALWDGTATLTDVVFVNCSTRSIGTGITGGGGIILSSGATTITNATFTDCSATCQYGHCFGGGLGLLSNSPFPTDFLVHGASFHATSATSATGAAFGGGVGIWSRGLTAYDMSFYDTFVRSVNTWAYGGGAAVHQGRFWATNVRFYSTSSHCETATSFGGGAGSTGGDMRLTSVLFDRSQVTAGLLDGLGGGFGMVAGSAAVRDATFVQTSASSAGGGVGMTGGSLTLLNATMALTPAGSAAGVKAGSHIFVRDQGVLSAAFLSLSRAACTQPDTWLIDASSAEAVASGDEVQSISHLNIDAPNCSNLITSGSQLVDCDTQARDACGLGAICTMSNEAVATPLCSCPQSTFPSPAAFNEALAPYTDGCIGPLVVQNVQREAEEASITLQKTPNQIPNEYVELILRVNGTAWVLRPPGAQFMWRAEVVLLDEIDKPWITLVNTTGNISQPRFIGAIARSPIAINVSSANMSDGIAPRRAEIRVQVFLPPQDEQALVDANATSVVVQNATIPIALSVIASPSASETTLTDGSPGFYDVLFDEGERRGSEEITFVARDLEGLQLERGGRGFAARTHRCNDSNCLTLMDPEGTDSPIRFVGVGAYIITSTIFHLDYHRVEVTLWDDPVPQVSPILRGGCGRGQFGRRRPVHECVPCPDDKVDCDQYDVFLETLPLTANHWRLSPHTVDGIRACLPDWRTGTATPCAGGDNVSSYCVPGHTGPMCLVCVAPWHYFDQEAVACRECPVSNTLAVVLPLAIFVFSCSALALMVAVFMTFGSRSKWANGLAGYTMHLWELNGVKAKLKVAAGFYQVATTLP